MFKIVQMLIWNLAKEKCIYRKKRKVATAARIVADTKEK
jgi:hypothetical protein